MASSATSNLPSQETWQDRVAEKRATCQNAIPEAWRIPDTILSNLPAPSDWNKSKINLISLDIPRQSGILTAQELEITESYDVAGLLDSLASGKLTSSEVTLAFSKRAAIAQQLTGCLTETFFDQAQTRARYLDGLREKGQLAGPLHGLPVSLKDSYQIKGVPATIGAVALLDKVSEENSSLVDILLQLGAVPYVKTNVSQVLMSVESQNNIFGRVLNPWNTMLTAGGSTGGEGALIALRGSLLGVGTDLAGSIRVPPLCCGVYGFKPTAARIAYGKQVMPMNAGMGAIVPSAGPLANDLKALQIFMKTVIDAKPFEHDSTAIDVPWREVEYPAHHKLRLGLLLEDPLFPVHPPVKEALDRAAQSLRSHGHEVIILYPEECLVAEISQIGGGLLSLDSTPGDLIAAGGEPVVPSVQNLANQSKNVQWKASLDLGPDRFENFALLQNKRAEMAEVWRKTWTTHKLDAVICAPAQHTAVQHDQYGLPVYSMFLNVLDYPACIIPFGNAITKGTEFTPKPGQGTPAYYPEVIEGAPCSVQVFTSRMRDEECLAIAGIVDVCLKSSS